VIKNLAAWAQFVARRVNGPPLVFLSGMRHVVGHGVCCVKHSHHAIEIVYHPRGRGITRLGMENRAVKFDQGDVVVYAPDEIHDQVMEREGEDLCVAIALPRGRHKVPAACFSVPKVEDAPIIEDIRLLSRGGVGLDPTEQAIFNLRATSTLYALVHLACARAGEDRDGTQDHVLKAEHYIRDHFATIKALPEVAEAIGISYDHLRHVFKAERKRSLVRYLNEVRMERAKTLLIHSRLPLKQVAAMCGFADEYYFSASFHRSAQMPPGRYRAMLS